MNKASQPVNPNPANRTNEPRPANEARPANEPNQPRPAHLTNPANEANQPQPANKPNEPRPANEPNQPHPAGPANEAAPSVVKGVPATVKERLLVYLKYKGLGQARFEKAVGLSNGYVNNIRRSIQPDKVDLITQAYPDLNPGWLLTGEGPMTRQQEVVPYYTEEDAEFYTENSHGIKYFKLPNGELLMQVPLLPFDAYASPEDENMDTLYPDRDEQDCIMFHADVVGHGMYWGFRVQGDSMDDGTRQGIQNGDALLVRELDRQDWAPRFHYDRWPIWVIAWDGNIRVKQIIDQDDRCITLHSLNPEYPDFRVRLDRIRRIFNVIKVRPADRSY